MLRSVLQLGFLLVLRLPGSDGNNVSLTVTEGGSVTLMCQEEFEGQTQCEFTDWKYTNGQRQTTLIERGEPTDGGRTGMKLLQNCSLVLHNVTAKQEGQYVCLQFTGNRGQSRFNRLSVASLSVEHDGRTLRCSVAASGTCAHEVKWINDGEEVTGDHGELQTVSSVCDVSVTLKDPAPLFPFYRTLKCEVTQITPKRTLALFPPDPPPPPEVSTTTTTTTTTTTSSSETLSSAAALTLKVVVPVVVAVTLIAAAVAVILWRRRKGRGETNGNIGEPEDSLNYVSVTFNRNKKKETKKVESRAEEADVTYSSVNVAAAARSVPKPASGIGQL